MKFEHTTEYKNLKIEELRSLAISKNGNLISNKYKDNKTKLKWSCTKQHEWLAAPREIIRGRWCPICYNSTEARRAAKYDQNKITEVKSAITAKGGICLSTEYINNRELLKIRCSNNHEWETTWKTINRGSWCPECTTGTRTKNKILEKQIKAECVAKERGGRLISKFTTVKSKLNWECALNHQWEATYPNVISNNSWCPTCAGGLHERICRGVFESLFDDKFPKMRPVWLRNSNNNLMELDGFNQKLKIAFEHNGAQHYKYSSHGFIKTKNELLKLQQYDNEKQKICIENNIILIIIPELGTKTPIIDLQSFIIDELKRYNIYPKNSNIIINYNLFYKKEPELQRHFNEIEKIVLKKGGKCLTDIYLSCEDKMNFSCKEGHNWKTTPKAIKSGRWCPTCANKTPLTIKNMQQLATTRNGKCLSEVYLNNHTKLDWQCGTCNNIWQATYNSVQRGDWCPPCSRKKGAEKRKLTLKDYQKAAELKNGKCLSTTYTNCHEKLTWQCAEGHIWDARADQIKNTTKWCKVCAYKNRNKYEKI